MVGRVSGGWGGDTTGRMGISMGVRRMGDILQVGCIWCKSPEYQKKGFIATSP